MYKFNKQGKNIKGSRSLMVIGAVRVRGTLFVFYTAKGKCIKSQTSGRNLKNTETNVCFDVYWKQVETKQN